MAEINYSTLDSDASRTRRYLWQGLGDDDQGLPIVVSERPDGSIQVTGTFAGATASLQGSNDGMTWVTLTDDQGNAIDLTAADLKAFVERTWKVRLITAGGAGTSIDGYLLLGS